MLGGGEEICSSKRERLEYSLTELFNDKWGGGVTAMYQVCAQRRGGP